MKIKWYQPAALLKHLFGISLTSTFRHKDLNHIFSGQIQIFRDKGLERAHDLTAGRRGDHLHKKAIKIVASLYHAWKHP